MNAAHRHTIARFFTVALCLMPTVAFAQRGMRGGGRGAGNTGKFGNLNRQSPIEVPKYVNAVNLLIEHRQDLALSDSQFTRVIRVKRSTDSTNAPLMRRLDSVQVLFKSGPLFGDQSPERRDSLALAKALIQETVGNVRDNIADGREKAYALLSSQQLLKAEGFEEKASKAIEDEKQAGRGRGGSGK
ncbi:MAG: hypothetical protein ABI442_09120 [Gemmatimonadaceae bacterium]